ncbi:MAG: D-alanine--D-alanine ligase [Halobacteriovorax sp.]|nr:D-alanine--D-alanine ligase [Halobacteriovorax sp.]
MKIAFVHNLKQNDTEEQAEFDTLETVEFLTDIMRELGHEVLPVDVTGSITKVIHALEAFTPDLVFNTAEGEKGRFRESLYPSILTQLDIPYTGSDPFTCALTLDKNLTKLAISQVNVPTPKSVLVQKESELKDHDLRFPLMLKPNAEGSSKGITPDSVVENASELSTRIGPLLKKYPDGILVEEFIIGKDITVPFLAGRANNGIMEPLEYVFDGDVVKKRKYQIYDYTLKNELADQVNVRCPAQISDQTKKLIQDYGKRIVDKIGIKDLARIDFRVTDDGTPYFIEINALPSLEKGAGLYEAAIRAGLKSELEVIDSVIKSAMTRFNLTSNPKKKRNSSKLRVGFAFNQKRIKPDASNPETDNEAEFDGPATLDAIRGAIKSFGHDVVDLEATPNFAQHLIEAQVDVVFNISEGVRGRFRESQVPATLDLMDIPYTGSDPSTLAITLDKAMAKRIVTEAGVKTPKFVTLTSPKDKIPTDMIYPMMVKPVAEGSSKGVLPNSVVKNAQELKEVVASITERYKQGALVEEFLTGREFTVGLLGEKKPEVLPPMEIVFNDKSNPTPIYTFAHKQDTNDEVTYVAPAEVDEKLKRELESAAKKCFKALGCRDVARMDFRLDGLGRVNFIECNPLPGLTPEWSDLCIIANGAGVNYQQLVGRILAPAIKRYKLKTKLLNT